MHQRIKYDVLSQKELEYMKGRLEQILIERGVHLDHEEMLKALEEKGCIVDMEARDVRFTKELIDKAIAAVPAEFTLYSPDGKHDLKFPSPDGRFYTRTCTGAPNYRNIKNETHYIKPEEEHEWYHLTNKMENLDYVTLPSVSGEYYPGDAIDVYVLADALKLSGKHIWIQPYEADNVQFLIDMAAAAVGGYDKLRERPIVSMIACSVPALTYKHMDAEILYLSAKYGVPVQPCALPTAGANTPVTAQGTAFVACADVLAAVQSVESGH